MSEYIKGPENVLPTCPSGGTYHVNDLQTVPDCTIGNNGTADTHDDHIVD